MICGWKQPGAWPQNFVTLSGKVGNLHLKPPSKLLNAGIVKASLNEDAYTGLFESVAGNNDEYDGLE